MKTASPKARPNKASAIQDKAAGGLSRRLMLIRSGDVVTVSMVITGRAPPSRVYLRFRSGGVMVTRPVGIFETAMPAEAIKLAWDKVRTENIAEQNQWAWINP